MKRLRNGLLILVAVGAFTACEKKDDLATETETTGGDAPAEKVVEKEIPEDLAKEAEAEVTADNAEDVAAELEKEIDEDSEE